MKKILVIEDELPIAELEKDYLELSGYEVTIESNGVNGEKLALTGDYDLVILDLMLPDKSGFDICRQLRKKFEIPVIIVSAKKDDIDKIHGLNMGADDYMTKPFSPSEMVARVRTHLTRYEKLTKKAEIQENEVVKVRELVIDRTARRVFVRGEEKTLTTKEFDLLYFLAKHPNHVYSKEELFQEIWGVTSLGEIATVIVHIKKIREKIELSSSNPQYIETIWGVGYRFRGK